MLPSRTHIAARRSGFGADRRGSIAVEFALVMPVLLILFMGTLRAGHALGVQHSLTQLAASAARHALPERLPERRATMARTYVDAHATSFPLLRLGAVECVARELNGTLTVEVAVDTSVVPTVPIVEALYAFPRRQVAMAAIAVQP